MQKRCFLSYEKPVTICRWIFLDISVTFTASLASTRRRACAAIRGTPGALFFPCVAAEKNSLRPVRTRPCHFLRSTHAVDSRPLLWRQARLPDRKSTRLNSSHLGISYAVFCLKKKKK